MSITSPTTGPGTPTVATEARTEEPAREAAIASLKRKRKFAEDLFAYLAVNGVLWLIWLLDRPVPRRGPAVARLGVDHLGLPARDRRLEGVRKRPDRP